MNDMFYKIEYCLKYKDEMVFKFNIKNKSLTMVNEKLLPLSLNNRPQDYSLVQKFIADRILMLNREFCKEILTACGIEDQNDMNICIVCKGLSFRDNYWISRTNSTEKWADVNLYQNEFSVNISKVALTGNMKDATIDGRLGDKIFTGELTNKGTRAKCYFRHNNRLYLFKHETREEIMSEMVTSHIADALNVPCSTYRNVNLYEKECSACEIFTSEDRELIPCRDILSHYNIITMNHKSKCYQAFMTVDWVNFMKMQILDYVTLNTDRNRDNFGLLSSNGSLISLFPLFDHDSCFKGVSTNGVYFPTGMTFAKTLEMLKDTYSDSYKMLQPDIQRFKEIVTSEEFKELFLKYKSSILYYGMIGRVNNL
ncbi:MAG: hypothetical protein IJP31_11470 [Lachnospiraceae bacterium]|nr:hypothetical protein [Lachnospiraceae bacterium]